MLHHSLKTWEHEPKCRALNSWRPLPQSKCHSWCSEGCFGEIFWVCREKKRAKAKPQTTVQKGCICWSHCCKNYSVILKILKKKIYFILSIYQYSVGVFFPSVFFPLCFVFHQTIHTVLCNPPLRISLKDTQISIFWYQTQQPCEIRADSSPILHTTLSAVAMGGPCGILWKGQSWEMCTLKCQRI